MLPCKATAEKGIGVLMFSEQPRYFRPIAVKELAVLDRKVLDGGI